MVSSRAFAGASVTADQGQVEWYLRTLAAPIIEFIEEASKLDDGYPDRYEGPREMVHSIPISIGRTPLTNNQVTLYNPPG